MIYIDEMFRCSTLAERFSKTRNIVARVFLVPMDKNSTAINTIFNS